MSIVALVVAVSLLDAPSQPAAAPDAAPAADVSRALDAVDAAFDDALGTRDRAALERVLADPFTWVHALDGRVDNRAVFLDQTASGPGLARQREQTDTFDAVLALHGSTAIRTARVRVRFRDGSRETWMRQTRVYVRDGSAWKLASGQGTRMYDGPLIDPDLYRRYTGTYDIEGRRPLCLEWDGRALLATYPGGTRTQVFLKSPTEEEALGGADRLRFTLDADGRPSSVALMRGADQVWRARRRP